MKIIHKKSLYIKISLIFLATIISGATIYYTQSLVEKLKEREKNIAEMYAATYNYILNSDNDISDYSFIFESIINRIEFPIISTEVDKNNQNIISLESLDLNSKNITFPTNLTDQQKINYLENLISELDEVRKPIEIEYNGKVIQRIHYGDSELIKKIKYYPYFQIVFAFFFLLIAYISFSHIKKSEQSTIWVGLSKETAHQLGTPISSLLGWNEYLQLNHTTPDKVLDISNEFSNDLERLTKITNRFSKIGSDPDYHNENVFNLVENVILYFQRRIPQFGKDVQLTIEGEQDIYASLSSELFEWVIENLTKNALDAIDKHKGLIHYNIYTNKNKIIIEISDNGKGIEKKNKKLIFNPGFSTKKRGWGLGLSLAKRIVEDYHNGKLILKHSEINQGTIFQIILKKN